MQTGVTLNYKADVRRKSQKQIQPKCKNNNLKITVGKQTFPRRKKTRQMRGTLERTTWNKGPLESHYVSFTIKVVGY